MTRRSILSSSLRGLRRRRTLCIKATLHHLNLIHPQPRPFSSLHLLDIFSYLYSPINNIFYSPSDQPNPQSILSLHQNLTHRPPPLHQPQCPKPYSSPAPPASSAPPSSPTSPNPPTPTPSAPSPARPLATHTSSPSPPPLSAAPSPPSPSSPTKHPAQTS